MLSLFTTDSRAAHSNSLNLDCAHCGQAVTFDDVKSCELIADGSLDEGSFIDETADVETGLLVHFANGTSSRRLLFVHLFNVKEGRNDVEMPLALTDPLVTENSLQRIYYFGHTRRRFFKICWNEVVLYPDIIG